jgi:hypothetical protein
MNVVFPTAHRKAFHTVVGEDSSYVPMQFRTPRCMNNILPFIYGKNNLICQLGVGVGHALFLAIWHRDIPISVKPLTGFGIDFVRKK